MSDFIYNFKDWINNITNEAIGNILINIGINTQEMAIIAITLGALLLICRYTKVLRWGIVSYLLGLLVELIGLSMIK